MKIELDMYQTLALAVLVLMLGKFLRERVRLLDKFCIPAPVIGGVLFAIFTCICYVTGVAEFAFDDTLKEVCMVMFFTSVGFQANLKVLKSGGGAQGGGTLDAKVLQHRAKGTGGAVAAHHGDGAGAKAHQRVHTQQVGQPNGQEVLADDQHDDHAQKHDHRSSTAFQHLEVCLEAHRGEKHHHADFL